MLCVVLKKLGQEICVGAVKMLAALEIWRFPAQCTTEPMFIKPGESSLSLSTELLAEKQDAPLQLSGEALGQLLI